MERQAQGERRGADAEAGVRPAPPPLDDETLAYAQLIFQLVRGGDAARLGPLLARGLPPNLCNQNGDSLLMLASYHGHAEAARLLLLHGADTGLRNDRGQTPLAAAAFKGDTPVVSLLLAHGADVEGVSPDGRTVLMLAAMFDRVEVLELLLAAGADMFARDGRGMTALDAARAMGAHGAAARLAALSPS
ncbi:MAG TPA: ankyrin repeat domain-containing protein [Noviherbaspirillum sp.]|jgi:ankyrin repeat protein|uniref:ankyrin repeat domain-containing protein n=1 Tax=Noviherbaspirillum sp. TaxID=1926288 RepID=UPI002F9304EC